MLMFDMTLIIHECPYLSHTYSESLLKKAYYEYKGHSLAIIGPNVFKLI